MRSTQVGRDASGDGDKKVFWTDREKELIVEEAVRLHFADPSLTGLALLRKAMKVLPAGRQRKLITLRQVPFFEPMLAVAVQAAEAKGPMPAKLVDHPDDPYLPIMRAYVGHLAEARDNMAQVAANQKVYIEQTKLVIAQNDRVIAGNSEILRGHEDAVARYEAQTDRLIASMNELVQTQKQSVEQMGRLLKEREETNRHLTVQDENARKTIALLEKLVAATATKKSA